MGGVIVRYRWTLSELLEANRWHQRKSRYARFRPWVFLSFAVLMLCAQALLFLRQDALRESWMTGPAIYLVILAALFPWLQRWAIRRNHAKSASRDTEIIWQITATSLRNETANSVAESKWTAFNQAVQTPGSLLLYPQPRLFYWLPRHGFETEEGFEAVTAWARQQIPAFRVLRR